MPTIRYATTSEGFRIAFHALGNGPAVVMLFPYHVNHLRLNWHVALHRGAIEFFARHFTVVNLDFRGAGLSERRIAGLSLEAFANDLDAVLARLRLDRVALFAMGPATLVACHYAARTPDRVASLVFIEGGESEVNRRILSLRKVSAHVEAKVRGALVGGIDDRHTATSMAALAHEALEPDSLKYWEDVLDGSDLLQLAACVAAPALYVNVDNDEMIPKAAAQALVDRMAAGTLISVPGSSPMDVWRDRAAVQNIAQFLARNFGVEADFLRAQRRARKNRVVHPTGLSEREAEVLRLLAAGKSNRQIANELFISGNTVSHHLRNIFAKTGTINRTQAASFAHQHGLLTDIPMRRKQD